MQRPFVIYRSGRLRLALFCLLLGTTAGHAQGLGSAPSGFQQGNAAYAAGKYAEAATAYENAARTGPVSANLYYNLGNTYDRLGARGKAMLNYQRALLLEPGQTEAVANLAFVQGRLSHPNRSGSWFGGLFALSGIDLVAILATAAAWLGLLLLVTGAFRYRARLAVAVGCFALSGSAAGLIWWLDDGSKNAGRALVLTEQTPALYAPAANSKVFTNLPLGSEVRVLSEQGAWIYAQLADGSRAWLAAPNVEKIIPLRASS